MLTIASLKGFPWKVCEPDNCFRSIIYNSKSRLSRTMIRITPNRWQIPKNTRTTTRRGTAVMSKNQGRLSQLAELSQNSA